MQGSKPAARRLAQPSPHSQCLADGGSVGFGARGLNELRQMVPLVEAMGYRPQPPAPAPAPASDTRAAQLLAMIPKMEAMGYRQAAAPQVPQYFAKGGMVRGPGTGTSDSIATEAEPGTFIMPADSTKAIGPSALEKLGTMPVRLSDGEFEIPPEQVMALGAAVLKLMKDATHKPVNGEDGGQTDAEVGEGEAEGGGEEMGEGAEHEQAEAAAGGVEDDPEEGAQGFQAAARERIARMPMFADGGLVDPRRPNSFGDAAAVAADPSVTQVRTSAADTFGNAPAPAPAAEPAPAVGSNLAAATRMGAYTDPRSTLYDPNPFAASNAAKIAAAGQSSRATIEAGMPPAPAPATARNSFGDAAAATRDASVTQMASGFQPNRGALSTVPAPSPVPALSTAAVTTPAAGAQTAAQRMAAAPAAPAAPMGWAERNAQRNAEVSAASIMNRPEWNRAAGFQPRRYADGGMVEDDLQKRLAQIPTGGPAGWTGGGAQAAPAPAPALSSMAAAPAPAPAAPAGALSRAASMATPPAPEPAAQPLSALADSTAQPTARSMDAADGLARRGAADALARMPNAPAPIQAPTIRHSGNDWQARNDLRNLEVSAKSIMNRPEWSKAGMGRFNGQQGPSVETAAYQSALANDLALRAAQPGMDQAAMRENADLQRAGLQTAAQAAEAAANRQNEMNRTLITERGNNSREGIRAKATVEAAQTKADATGNKPLAGPVLKQLQEARDNAVTIGNLNNSFKPEYANKGILGVGADLSLMGKSMVGSDKDAVDWWKNYRKQAELTERHALFGASLTPGEQDSWRSADIGPGMHPDVITKNLATRAALASKMFGNTRQDLIDAGHSEDRINAIANRETVAPPKEATAAAVPDGAIAHLRSNPTLAAQFDAKYGAGASSRYLGK